MGLLPGSTRRRATRAISCLACLVMAGFAAGAQAASSSPQPLKLEHLDYFPARKIILRHGWKPLGGGCPNVNQATCKRFPEAVSCAGVWPGNCAMVFVRQ